jgi:hypothetical protein
MVPHVRCCLSALFENRCARIEPGQELTFPRARFSVGGTGRRCGKLAHGRWWGESRRPRQCTEQFAALESSLTFEFRHALPIQQYHRAWPRGVGAVYVRFSCKQGV